MALELNFKNIYVKRTLPKQFRISGDMELVDGANILLSHSFGCDYKPGDNIADRIDAIKDELQEALDIFADEYQLKNSSALSNKLNALKTELTIPQLQE